MADEPPPLPRPPPLDTTLEQDPNDPKYAKMLTRLANLDKALKQDDSNHEIPEMMTMLVQEQAMLQIESLIDQDPMLSWPAQSMPETPIVVFGDDPDVLLPPPKDLGENNKNTDCGRQAVQANAPRYVPAICSLQVLGTLLNLSSAFAAHGPTHLSSLYSEMIVGLPAVQAGQARPLMGRPTVGACTPQYGQAGISCSRPRLWIWRPTQ